MTDLGLYKIIGSLSPLFLQSYGSDAVCKPMTGVDAYA